MDEHPSRLQVLNLPVVFFVAKVNECSRSEMLDILWFTVYDLHFMDLAWGVLLCWQVLFWRFPWGQIENSDWAYGNTIDVSAALFEAGATWRTDRVCVLESDRRGGDAGPCLVQWQSADGEPNQLLDLEMTNDLVDMWVELLILSSHREMNRWMDRSIVRWIKSIVNDRW